MVMEMPMTVQMFTPNLIFKQNYDTEISNIYLKIKHLDLRWVIVEIIQFSQHQNSISPLMITAMPGLVSKAVTSIVQILV